MGENESNRRNQCTITLTYALTGYFKSVGWPKEVIVGQKHGPMSSENLQRVLLAIAAVTDQTNTPLRIHGGLMQHRDRLPGKW